MFVRVDKMYKSMLTCRLARMSIYKKKQITYLFEQFIKCFICFAQVTNFNLLHFIWNTINMDKWV